MKKPTATTRTVMEYSEAAEYIESLLGYQLRDTLARFETGKINDDREYRDFWHLICDSCDVHNGSYIHIPEGEQEWQKDISKAFYDVFGEDQEYWVQW